jgi:UDP-galactopyranose mutase
MIKKRILILGGGLAGLSTAWHLQKRGFDCQIFEQESAAGGLCRSKKIGGFTFDCDGHLLHFKHRYAFDLVKNLLGNNLAKHQRSAWIYSAGSFSHYPFQANLYGLPKSVIQECLLGFIQAYHRSYKKVNNQCSFQDWIMRTFGKGIAQHFMIPYNTKFWTHSPKKLTCEWLDGFIPAPSLKEVIDGTVEPNQRQFGYNAVFWYPKKGGINQLPSAFAREVKNLYTDCRVTKIDLVKKRISLASGGREKFDFLISTIPLPEIPSLIDGLPKKVGRLFRQLKWNSIFNLNLGLKDNDPAARHWVYFPQQEISFFRVGYFHNFSSSLVPAGKHSLYVETAYSKNKPIDKNKIVLRSIKDLKKINILRAQESILALDVNDIKYGYPVYDYNYRLAREGIAKFLVQNNILSCGRYGSWRYMSMEDVILEGKDIAAKVLNLR